MTDIKDQILLDSSSTGKHQVWFTRPEASRAIVLAAAIKQSEIDRLMLEFCPERMTEEQIENWEKHQAPVSAEDYRAVCRNLGLPC